MVTAGSGIGGVAQTGNRRHFTNAAAQDRGGARGGAGGAAFADGALDGRHDGTIAEDLRQGPRFHVVDLRSGQVESFRVAHGRGSDPDHSGFVERFSNDFGSHATSNGTYITGDYYQGKYGLSMKTHGLDWTNNNAESRAIVIHNAWYAEPEMIAQTGKLGRSQGCFAFSRADQWDVMKRLAGGRMIYADKIA